MSNLLKSLKDRDKNYLGAFVLEIKDQNEKLLLKFAGDFIKEQDSVYARYTDMGLVAGSQNHDIQLAKTKALIRLLHMIELKLLSFKDEGDYSNLFRGPISAEVLDMFTAYAKAKELFAEKYSNDDENIPVYREEFVKDDDNNVAFSYTEISPVTDVKNIQKAKSELLESLPKKEITNYSAIESHERFEIRIDAAYGA